jgi:hypothetical protein
MCMDPILADSEPGRNLGDTNQELRLRVRKGGLGEFRRRNLSTRLGKQLAHPCHGDCHRAVRRQGVHQRAKMRARVGHSLIASVRFVVRNRVPHGLARLLALTVEARLLLVWSVAEDE